MYEAEMSGDTDKMRIRGSEAGTLDSPAAAMLDGLSTLLMSAPMITSREMRIVPSLTTQGLRDGAYKSNGYKAHLCL